MPAALRLTVDMQVLVDRRPGLGERISQGLESGARAAMQEYLEALEERLITQQIPGPPLSPHTIAIKRRHGAAFPEYKWLFEDIAIAKTQIITERHLEWAAALLIAPAERPFFIYRLLELGGINETGNVVSARPLFTTTARAASDRMEAGFRRGFYQGADESP